jgi:predicted transcriptional regulator
MAFTVRTDPEFETALAALAEAEGLSRQEVVRRAVLERFHQSLHDDRVGESMNRLIERWGDVIDKLGSA